MNNSVRKRLRFYVDENGEVAYEQKQGKKLNKKEQIIVDIINDHSINVNVYSSNSDYASNGRFMIGGAFLGNSFSGDKIEAFQEINPYLLDIMSRESGHDDLILHEITESYEGANISRKNNKESPAAGVIGSVYEEAHNNAAIPQPAIFYLWGYDEDNNTIYGDLNLVGLTNDANGGMIDSQNGIMQDLKVGLMTLNSAIDMKMDINVTDKSADTITVADSSTGTINIVDIQFETPLESTSDTIRIIYNSNADTILTISDSIKNQIVDEEELHKPVKDDYKIDKIIDDYGNEIIFKHKSRIYPKKMYITRDDKGLTKSGNVKKQTITVDQKQMVYYSQKYADKQKRDRQMVIEKAKDLIKNPGSYTRTTSYGAAGYINNIKFDKETGVVSNSSNLSLDLDKIKEEEKLDGYYSIVTSEENLSDLELRNIYKGLSKIEETFKITKSEFDARPINVRLEDHIDAHFLICFISLVIIRLLQQDINHKYTIKNILEKMKNFKKFSVLYFNTSGLNCAFTAFSPDFVVNKETISLRFAINLLFWTSDSICSLAPLFKTFTLSSLIILASFAPFFKHSIDANLNMTGGPTMTIL